VALVEQALRNGMDAMTICNQGLLPGLGEVGRQYLCPGGALETVTSVEPLLKDRNPE